MSTPTTVPNRGYGEQEPLLGRPGDVSQPEGKGIQNNLISGTAVVAQGGIWILVALVWASVFTHPLILFSAHPLLNSAGILLLTQGALLLQPTHTPQQKVQGAHIHGAINGLGSLLLIAGLVIIEYNKISAGIPHFESAHAILGLITSIFVILQALVGITQFYIPNVYGGVNNAKKIYKYHRMGGYATLILALATIAAATQTGYNKGVLGIPLWAVIVTEILVLAGVLPRIKKQKFGF